MRIQKPVTRNQKIKSKKIFLSIRYSLLSTLILVCLILPQAVSLGATYYVSPAGSDTNDGSSGSPWKTVEQAEANANPGSTIKLRTGQGR